MNSIKPGAICLEISDGDTRGTVTFEEFKGYPRSGELNNRFLEPFRDQRQDRMTVMLFLNMAAAKAKNMPPIAITNANCGHTRSMPAPR